MGEGSDMPTNPHHTPTIIPPSTSQPQRKQRPTKPKRKDTEIPQSSVPVENVADEAVYEERDDRLERATTTAIGLDAEQDRGGGPRRQDTMGDIIAQTRVLDLENTKTAQAHEITCLKKRVKKLERKKKSRTHGLKRLYKVGLSARIDSSNDEATLGDQEDASKLVTKSMGEKEALTTANILTTANSLPTSKEVVAQYFNSCHEFAAEFFDSIVLMPRVVKSRDEIFSRWGYCDNHDLSRLDNQSIERDRLIGIGFVLDFVEFISFTFGDKEMISVIEAVSR
ncbi:hypothetical protein Tco_0874858 [Tanacetum coccineum]|uniref:Uncharacterized protein n=1 Tax=Tanacetum coccineum TaxID=301880 RepID=A0ABQ5BQT2_9ASTR